MKKYKCKKTVLAEEMYYKEAGKKGLIRDFDPNREDEIGFHVIYEDGYESWSPLHAFLNGYEEIKEDGD